jgi:hypothetical protein
MGQGMGVWNETNGSNEGLELWKRCSQRHYEGYDEALHHRKWRSFGGAREVKISIATIIAWANEDAPDQVAVILAQRNMERQHAVEDAIIQANPLPPILDPYNQVYFSDIEEQLGANPTMERLLEVLRQVIAYIDNGGNSYWLTKTWNRMRAISNTCVLRRKRFPNLVSVLSNCLSVIMVGW